MGSMSCNFYASNDGRDPVTLANLAGSCSRHALPAAAFRRPAGHFLISGTPPMQSQQLDPSRALIRRHHPHGRCTLVASARPLAGPGQAGVIHMAMVVGDGGRDHLYLSLSNPASDMDWRAAPAWIACPFDGGGPPPEITAVRISDANDGVFIVVDTAGQHGAAAAAPARYYIDTGRAGAPRWVAHRPPMDAAAKIAASCLGRSRGGWDVDGVYLASTVGGAPQLIYSPLCNPFMPAMPAVSRRLALPDERAAETIAACRHADNTSDLFATAEGALYFFSAANQFDGAQALRLLADPLFAGVRKLAASAAGGYVTVWGWNAAGQVVTTGADQVYMADPERWSRPRIVQAGDALPSGSAAWGGRAGGLPL
jgi:hypothetical protein